MTGDGMAHFRGLPVCGRVRARVDIPTMSWGFQEATQAGPTRVKPIQTGCQCERQVWPILHEHAHPQATSRPAVRRLVAFPITVPADKKPTLTRGSPAGFVLRGAPEARRLPSRPRQALRRRRWLILSVRKCWTRWASRGAYGRALGSSIVGALLSAVWWTW